MKKICKQFGFLVFCSLTVLTGVEAQEIEPKQEINIDDLGDVSDDFQEYFFEALRQKAITNYDKAIEALEKCLKINPSASYIHFELGKNYLKLKQYQNAQEGFEKVLQAKPNDKYVLELLFEVYFSQRKYKESVAVLEKLVVHNPLFKEQLANMYFLEKRYDDALSALDELDDEFGADSYRNKLRDRIHARINNKSGQIARLENKIKEQPNSERNYINLIYLYSKNNQKEKAYETAKELLKKKPDSELVHLALYKFYLEDNKVDESVNSMKVVLASKEMDVDSKQKVLNDFLDFVSKNPSYESELIETSLAFSEEEKSQKIFKEIGNYFFGQDKKELALNFYEKGMTDNFEDFDLLKRMLLLQLDLGRYEKAKEGSAIAIEMFPSQPILYLVNGVSLLHLEEAKTAVEILSQGMDYIIDDVKMESDFYLQMGIAYGKLGESAKANKYKKKSEEIQNKS
ncbi:tetratricopeptide repeat protein [Aquimarina hainanensis]|uniref:Tetratricopeptide repeat protein n=1 Tax=Aquimarina hainanensis TaxID=1578017 RepID=A0ABW5N550_9FLAO|nr:tetratricopeptide repeat protein [Aquimarina sp. TRL1]QKX04744.1 tetratricopeptide repeat protein [Aquimarina sp. TRL1]